MTGKQNMKELLLLVLLVFPVWAYGQSHLTFMGHPITGDMKSFVKVLEADGFETQNGKA